MRLKSALVAAAVLGLFLILNRTRLGLRIRAGTLDLETVSVLGVNVRMLRSLNFGLGIYLAGLAGVLAAGGLLIVAAPNVAVHLQRKEILFRQVRSDFGAIVEVIGTICRC